MRIVRVVVGMLLLTIGLPVLLAGGALWTAMQYRDGGGAFSGSIERITTPGHAVVVPDLDALLHRDAPFARAHDTRLRVTARTEAGPALVGIAAAADAARYLAGVPYAQVDGVRLTSGPLPVRVTAIPGAAAPSTRPGWAAPPGSAAAPGWVRQGAGAVDWASSEMRGQRVALVVTHPDVRAGLTVDLRVEMRPGWLGSATAGLLLLGAALVAAGIATVAWRSRPAPASVPVSRPVTLADLLPASPHPVPPLSVPVPPVSVFSAPALSGPALSGPAFSGPAFSGPPLSGPVFSGPVEVASGCGAVRSAPRVGLWGGMAAPIAPILAWPPHPRCTVTPEPLPVFVPFPARSGPTKCAAPAGPNQPGLDVPDSRLTSLDVPCLPGSDVAGFFRGSDVADSSSPGSDVPDSSLTALDVTDSSLLGRDDSSLPSRDDSSLPSRDALGAGVPGSGVLDSGLPGSAGLASALDTLGASSRPARRRKTAAGLPTDHLPR